MPEIVRGRKGTAGAQCPHLRSLQDSLSPPPYFGEGGQGAPLTGDQGPAHKIGVNINQIARSVNAGIAKAEDARRGLYLLEQVYELMYEVAKK